jgi:hypothetical protein
LNDQSQFDFSSPAPDGLTRWRQERELAWNTLAARLGMPLGHPVEVWLKNGIKLTGRLELKENALILDVVNEKNLELCIGRADFNYAEIESCVRTD